MSRYIGPKIRIIRRLGELPGLTKKITKRETLPGQHKKLRNKTAKGANYAARLEEKQKLRFNYGLNERQLVKYVKEAKRVKGATGAVLLQLLEMRLENIIFRCGLGRTIAASRQLVSHGHIYVNTKKITIPSFQCHPSDIFEVKNKPSSKQFLSKLLEESSQGPTPSFIEFEKETLKGKITRIIENNEITLDVNQLLIVEYYSK